MARTRRKKTKITARMFERLRIEASEIMRELQKGKKRGPHSEEHKRRLSESRKRYYEDPANREKARVRSTGSKHSEECKALMSAQRKGKPIPKLKGHTHNLGSTRSSETKAKMRAAWERRRANPEDGTLSKCRGRDAAREKIIRS